MKILVVEDEPVARTLLIHSLKGLGHEVLSSTDGKEAWEFIQKNDIRVVVSDWMMPEMDGIQLCQSIRKIKTEYVYFILLTSNENTTENRKVASDAGVDDFLNKPMDVSELWTRLRVAERILGYTKQVRQLEEILPICSYCKKIRNDKNYWQQIELYISEKTGSEFSHSICPDCFTNEFVPQMKRMGISDEQIKSTCHKCT